MATKKLSPQELEIKRQTKQSALDAALRLKPLESLNSGQLARDYDVVAKAQKIYDWLIK